MTTEREVDQNNVQRQPGAGSVVEHASHQLHQLSALWCASSASVITKQK